MNMSKNRSRNWSRISSRARSTSKSRCGKEPRGSMGSHFHCLREYEASKSSLFECPRLQEKLAQLRFERLGVFEMGTGGNFERHHGVQTTSIANFHSFCSSMSGPSRNFKRSYDSDPRSVSSPRRSSVCAKIENLS